MATRTRPATSRRKCSAAGTICSRRKTPTAISSTKRPHHHRLYAQAQATIAICELYGMTKDEKFKKPAQLALDYAHKAQAPEGRLAL